MRSHWDKQTSIRWSSQHLINQHLTTACDFGNKDAAFLLASRALNCASEFTYPAEDAVVFLKLAAERGHAEAAYELGCCYAAMGKFISAEQSCTKYFNSIDPRERQRLAEHYFHIAYKGMLNAFDVRIQYSVIF